MNIEKLKELSVPVSERKPKIRENVLAINDKDKWQSECFWSGQYWFNVWDDDKCPCYPSHWIDFDLLTKKTTAIELMKEAYNEGRFYDKKKQRGAQVSETDLLTKNINKL